MSIFGDINVAEALPANSEPRVAETNLIGHRY